MASYSYTKTTWVNASTALSQTNLNNIEDGVNNAKLFKVDVDGSTPITGTQDFQQTLGGADKTFWRIVPTGDKTYAAIVRNSDKALKIRNTTDSADLLELGPAAGVIKANGNTIWHSGNDGSGSGLDADLLDGITAAGFATKSAQSSIGINMGVGQSLPGAGMSKGDVFILTSFALP
jgi:hypothetical protein